MISVGVDGYRGRLAGWLKEVAPETLAAYAFSDREGCRRLATTNSIEYDHAEVHRSTSVIRVFPNEASFVHLAPTPPPSVTSSGLSVPTSVPYPPPDQPRRRPEQRRSRQHPEAIYK